MKMIPRELATKITNQLEYHSLNRNKWPYIQCNCGFTPFSREHLEEIIIGEIILADQNNTETGYKDDSQKD